MKLEPSIVTVLAFVLLSTSACGAWIGVTPKYIVTTEPLSVYNGLRGLCFAIDPGDPKGLWWWGPGRTGCATRNTTSDPANASGLAALFHQGDATVASLPGSGQVQAHFRLGLHGPPDLAVVDLIADGEHMRSVQTGAQVNTRNVNMLDIPLLAPYGRPF